MTDRQRREKEEKKSKINRQTEIDRLKNKKRAQAERQNNLSIKRRGGRGGNSEGSGRLD